MKHTKAPWKAEMTDEWNPETDEIRKVQTGWIENVVEYKGCGTHQAEWKNPYDFTLVLASPDLLIACKLALSSCDPHSATYKYIEAAIEKAEPK